MTRKDSFVESIAIYSLILCPISAILWGVFDIELFALLFIATSSVLSIGLVIGLLGLLLEDWMWLKLLIWAIVTLVIVSAFM